MGQAFYRRANRTHLVNLVPVPDMPALIIEGRRRWVCVADLHMGIETALRGSGFNIPSQLPKMSNAIESLGSHADRLVILGDVKHRITHAGHGEDRDVRAIMQRIMRTFQAVVVTPGNHDGGLKDVMPDGCIITANHGTVVEEIGAFHGHVWPSEEVMACNMVVMGHVHPSVRLEDAMGGGLNEKCWMRARFSKTKVAERYDTCPKELVVVPAFNPLITGSPINAPGGGRLGPLLRNKLVNERSISAYLLNGTNLGRPPRRKARTSRRTATR
jgi:putative SbcD/Mre11-related phosphoesterase